MRVVKRNAGQGDVMFIRVNKLPDDVKLLNEGKEVIVAHSETGHHHTAVADKIRLYGTSDPMICYLVNETGAHMDIVHQRSFDTHETLRLLDGPWKIVRERENTPEGWRPVVD
jgi:hypothetical protein